MKILGLDLETNGLDVQKCAVVEMGLCLWDTDRSSLIEAQSFLVNDTKSPTYGDWKVCEKLSGITKEDIDQFGINPQQAHVIFRNFADRTDVILAANGLKFDKLVLAAYEKRYEVPVKNDTWVDLYQLPFPETCKYRNLLYLAAYYGFINPFPHRALSDTMTMIKIATNFDILSIVNNQKLPAVTLVAKVSYNNRAQASERGFAWNGTKKIWYRVVRENELEALSPVLATYPFEVNFVEGDLS